MGQENVELRRFLVGVPFSHERAMSTQERQHFARSAAIHLIFGAALLSIAIGLKGIAPPFDAVAVPIAVTAFLAARFPLVGFMKGKVDVYVGRCHLDVGTDAPAVSTRPVEILAVDDRPWRIEGRLLSASPFPQRPVEVATLPDREEQGERRLTPEESTELRRRARSSVRIDVVEHVRCGYMPIIMVIASLLYDEFFRGGASMGMTWAALGLLGLGFIFGIVRRASIYLRLSRDLKLGVVASGRLASGTPWVVDGQPAGWRLYGLTPDQVERLALDRRSDDEDDVEFDELAERHEQALRA